MTEAQVWTMMGVFTTLLLGMMTILSTTFVRILRAETGRTNDRIDALDRDVGLLTRRLYGLGPGEPEV